MKIDNKASINDILKLLQKEEEVVDITLSSGNTIKGVITQLGLSFVVIKLYSPKDFYDAIIMISEIVAIEYQARSE